MSEGQAYRFSICRLIGTLGVLCVIVGSIVIAGEAPPIFINVPSGLITVGITFFLLLGAYGGGFLRFIPASLATLFCSPLKPNPLYAAIAKSGSRYAIGAGLIGALIGTVIVLKHAGYRSQIGPGIAVALFTLLYAFFLSRVFFAFVYEAYTAKRDE